MGEVRVLLVEDDPADARLLQEELALRGGARHRVEHVTTLAGARERLDADPAPDVVLLDLSLPDSTGLASLDRILDDLRVPVVVLTGLDDDELARTAVERGAQDYLVKGTVTGDTVGRAVRHAIERNRLRIALNERVKELAGLAAITRTLLEDAGLHETCQRVATHLAGAMQFPDLCRADVRVDTADAAAGPPRHAESETLAASVAVEGRVRGQLRVGYAQPHLGFLLPEEQQLIDAASEALAGWLRRRDVLERVVRDEEQLRVLVSNLPGMIWTTDRHLRATSYAGASIAELGIDEAAYLGLPIGEVMDVPMADETVGLFRQALAGESAVFERAWRGRWWRNHLAPKRDAHGRVVGTVCLTLDATTEHEQAAELDATRERLEGLFVNAGDAMLLADDDGAYLDANPAASALTGYAREELLAMRAWDLGANDLEDVDPQVMWHEFVAEGRMAGLFPLRHRDGHLVVTDFRAVADIVPGVHLWIMRDMTDRARAEQALAASEQLFRTMAESAQDAIYRVRLAPSFLFEYLNPAGATITGFPVGAYQVNPRLYLERAHAEDVGALDSERLVPGTTTAVTFRFQHADGHWIWLEDHRSPIVEDGRVVGVQGVVRDITNQERIKRAMQDALDAERRAGERLRAADELKNAFLTAVSHELRTPLTSVLGYAETLLERGDELPRAQVQGLYGRLAVNAVRLDELLSDLLDVGRLSRGTVQLDRVTTDLTELVRVVAAEVDLGGRRLVVDPVPAVAEVDPTKLARIVHNLVANAVRHTPPGSTIWTTCRVGPAEATIEVADDGPGVDPAQRGHVFEPFWQGPETRDAASPGTGIGLSLVRQFAVLHGGTVEVGERRGGGARFRVTLPARSDVDLDQPA